MIKRFTFFPVILFLLLSAAACTKKGATGPAGPAGPAGTSATSGVCELNGHVSLYDQYGTRQFLGLKNVRLALRNGTFTYADSTGFYIFPALASSGYTVTASASGYAATAYTANLASDTLYKDVKLSAIPTFQVVSMSAYHNAGSANDSLILSFDADTRQRNCIVFASSLPTVSNQPGNYMLSYTHAIVANATRVQILVPATDLNGANIFYGQRVYYVAYSYVVNDVSVYEDQNTGKNVYNAVGTAVIDSALCP